MGFTTKFHNDHRVRIAEEHPKFGCCLGKILTIVYYIDEPKLWVRPDGHAPTLIEESMLTSVEETVVKGASE